MTVIPFTKYRNYSIRPFFIKIDLVIQNISPKNNNRSLPFVRGRDLSVHRNGLYKHFLEVFFWWETQSLVVLKLRDWDSLANIISISLKVYGGNLA